MKRTGYFLISAFILIFLASCGDDDSEKELTDQALPVCEEEMVLVPAGDFEMGDHRGSGHDYERPVHTVYLNAFYIDKYEVTNAHYARFLNDYGRTTDPAGHDLITIAHLDCKIEEVGGSYRPEKGYDNHPVVCVSWYGAAAYAQFYGKRLPTEAQWEKAARGGLVGKKYPWGDTIPTQDDANCLGTDGRDIWNQTSPVGSFPSNGYGLHDMAGNVWEWCADEFSPDYYRISPRDNPRGPGPPIEFRNDDFINVKGNVSRVYRGGGWELNPQILSVSIRDFNSPSYALFSIGFRCAVNVVH